jgi:hypothetical protein
MFIASRLEVGGWNRGWMACVVYIIAIWRRVDGMSSQLNPIEQYTLVTLYT